MREKHLNRFRAPSLRREIALTPKVILTFPWRHKVMAGTVMEGFIEAHDKAAYREKERRNVVFRMDFSDLPCRPAGRAQRHAR